MSSEIKRYRFNGHAVEPRVEGDRVLFSFEDVAALCEYANLKQARQVFLRNKKEFVEGDEFMVFDSKTVRGRTYGAHFLTPLGLHHYAMLCDTEVASEFRKWVVATFLRPHLSGARMITREQFDAMRAERDEWRTRALDADARFRALDLTVARLTGRIEQMAVVLDGRASDSARSLNEYRRLPEIAAIAHDRKRREQDERRGGRQAYLFEGASGPEAFAALKAKLLEAMVAETASGAPLKYRKHALAKLVKAPHRQAVAAVESLLARGEISVQGGNVTVKSAVTPG